VVRQVKLIPLRPIAALELINYAAKLLPTVITTTSAVCVTASATNSDKVVVRGRFAALNLNVWVLVVPKAPACLLKVKSLPSRTLILAFARLVFLKITERKRPLRHCVPVAAPRSRPSTIRVFVVPGLISPDCVMSAL
jgi:hypothetical protein